jgi:hypothetical protein
MKKKLFLILIIISFTTLPIFSQAEDPPINFFEEGMAMTGLLCEATGFGLVVGGGAATSVSLDAALIMMKIAPVFSTVGAWCTQSFMTTTSEEWKARGLQFDTSGYIADSNNAAIGTTAFTAGALLAPLIPEAGIYISLACTAVAVIWDMFALYGPRQEWLMEMNEAILASGLKY